MKKIIPTNVAMENANFSQILGSCRSLSKYEKRNFKNLIPQILATLSTASFHLGIGISLAYSAILIPQLEEDVAFDITKSQTSWIASVMSLASLFGTISSGFLMDFIGRLNTLRLAAIPAIFGWFLIASATNVTMLILGRICVGIANALGSSPIIVYVTEIARADMRGSLISLTPTFTSLGMIICYLEGWFLNWRTVAYVTIAILVIPCVLTTFIPESPAWLLSKGRLDQAQRALDWIDKYQPHPENKTENFATLRLTLMRKEQEKKSIERGFGAKIKLFLQPTGYKPLLILFGLFCINQFSGVFIILYYSINFFKETGTTINPYLASVILGLIRLIMSSMNTYIMKIFNKRPLIIISGVGMALSIFVSSLFTYWIKSGLTSMTWVPVVSLIIYILMTMVGASPIPPSMTAELFPIEIRALAHSFVRTTNNILTFSSVKSYPFLYDLFNGLAGLQCFFGVVSVVGVVYSYIFLPETRGKKLQDIQDYFKNHTCYVCEAGRNDKNCDSIKIDYEEES